MNCEQCLDLIDDLVSGEVAGRTARKLQAHIAECSLCAARLRRAQEMRTVLRQEPPVLDDERRRRILRRVDSLRSLEEPRRVAPRVPVWRHSLVLTASALSAVLVLGITLGWLGLLGPAAIEAGPVPTPAELNAMSFSHAARSNSLGIGGHELMRDAMADDAPHWALPPEDEG